MKITVAVVGPRAVVATWFAKQGLAMAEDRTAERRTQLDGLEIREIFVAHDRLGIAARMKYDEVIDVQAEREPVIYIVAPTIQRASDWVRENRPGHTPRDTIIITPASAHPARGRRWSREQMVILTGPDPRDSERLFDRWCELLDALEAHLTD